MLTTFAPPFKLVATHFLFGLLYLFLSLVYFIFSTHDLDDFTFIAFLHSFLLGFVINIIIGALYQLSSVILQKPFVTIKGTLTNAFMLNISIMILFFAFFKQDLDLAFFAGVIAILSLGYFLTLFLISFVMHIRNAFAPIIYILAGFYFLAALVCAALMLLYFYKGYEFNVDLILKLHIYFACGFIYLIIVSTSTVLIPMFALSHKMKFYLSKASVLIFMIVPFVNFNKLIIAVSILCFIGDIIFMLFRRIRKTYDYWNLNIYLSLAGLILSIVFYFIRGEYGLYFFFIGFLYPFICANLYKILPFLIWYHYISPFAMKMKVPKLADMLSPHLAYLAMIFNIFAIASIFIMIYFTQLYFVLFFMLVSIILLFMNIFKMFQFIKFTQKEKNEKTNS